MSRHSERFRIGVNNVISKTAVIHENVFIGNNNFIGENTIIYPKTIIGDNNIIFNRNVIGEFPISSRGTYDYEFDTVKGTIIGNNNILHVNNIIFSGISSPTKIGNNNKLLAEIHIGHDAIILNNVTIYARSIIGGYARCLDSCNIGMAAVIHQKRVIGQYSMIGANNTVTKHVFPYYININNELARLNETKTPDYIDMYDNELRVINKYVMSNEKLPYIHSDCNVNRVLNEYVNNIVELK
jgi:UDP-N-acetylglucosamine acyltransferase